MQSKWLSWQPGSVGFVGALQGEDSIIESKGSVESAISCSPVPAASSIIENYPGDLASKPTKHPPPDSAYAELVDQAMQRIAKVCPPGALKWAREAHPGLAQRIDVQIFTQLDELWSTYAPPAEFQGVLDDLVDAHGAVGRLYAQSRR
jgi:hypothetical protein